MARGATARDKAAKATEPGSSTSILITAAVISFGRLGLQSVGSIIPMTGAVPGMRLKLRLRPVLIIDALL